MDLLDTDPLERLAASIRDRTAVVAVIGLGYVGLPLLVGVRQAGFETIGLDADPTKIGALRAGRSYIVDVPSSEIAYKSEFGMSLPEFKKAWDAKYADGKVEFGFNSVAGYTTGLVLEKALSVTESMDQLALRKAIFSLSGKLKTLVQCLAISAILFCLASYPPSRPLVVTRDVLIWLAVILIVYSGVGYVMTGMPQLRGKTPNTG